MDLNTLKNNYAKEYGYEDWEDLSEKTNYADDYELHWTSVCLRAQKEALENAMEILERKIELTSEMGMEKENWAFSQSYRIITNPENLIR